MVGLGMVDDNIVNFIYRDQLFDIGDECIGMRVFDRVDEDGFFIPDQVGVVARPLADGQFMAVKMFESPLNGAYPVNIGSDDRHTFRNLPSHFISALFRVFRTSPPVKRAEVMHIDGAYPLNGIFAECRHIDAGQGGQTPRSISFH